MENVKKEMENFVVKFIEFFFLFFYCQKFDSFHNQDEYRNLNNLSLKNK